MLARAGQPNVYARATMGEYQIGRREWRETGEQLIYLQTGLEVFAGEIGDNVNLFTDDSD